MLRGFAALSCALLCTWRTSATNTYVTEKDRTVAREAQEAVARYCGDGLDPDFDEAEARTTLNTVIGGENVILDILRSANSSSGVADDAREKMANVSYMQSQAQIWAPMVMAFIFLALWPFCFVFSTPCCKCCRCCRKERETSCLTKIVLLVALAGLVIGLISCAALGRQGYDSSKEGFRSLVCTAAEMQDTFLSGQDGDFMGIMPALDEYYGLEAKLDNGSSFLVDLDAILDSTLPVQRSVDVAAETLALLKDMLEEPSNTGAGYMHECLLCVETASALGESISALESGIASALADARSQVASQLGPTQRADLQQQIRAGSTDLTQWKGIFVDAFRDLTKPNGLGQTMNDTMNTQGFYALNSLFVAAFVLLTCAGFGAACFTFRERSRSRRVGNPYSKSVHRCACLSWQCGFAYVIVAFLLGGLLTLVTFVTSNVCLTMDEMNREVLLDIGPTISLPDPSTPGGRMMLDLMDQCVVPMAPGGQPNIMDIIIVDPATNETMRNKTVDMVITPINEKFAAINSSSAPLAVADQQSIVALRAMLRNNPMDALLLPTDAVQTDPTYSKFALDSRGSSDPLLGLQVGWMTSCACADHTSAEFSGLPLNPVPGLSYFATKMSHYGTLVPSSDCVQNVTCTGLSVQDTQACEAANDFAELKRQLRSTTTFRCDVFEMEDSSPCDPKAMTLSGGTYSSDCVRADGTMVRKQINCDLAAFTTYVADFDVRIQKVMDRLDASVAATQSSINVNLKNLVDEHIVSVINGIMDGMGCAFLSQKYRQLVQGCFQGTVGVLQISNSYVASAYLVLLLMLVAYALWRRAVDNVNSYSTSKVVEIAVQSVLPKGA